MRTLLRLAMTATAAASVLMPSAARAEDIRNLPPYKMIRSLQYVQDSVVLGDHSAIEMQRYMLGAIDERLRASDSSVFNDPRNVDAALVYAMSGGNPETLLSLTARDIEGNFDMRITDALRAYLNGKGAIAVVGLSKAAAEYRTSRLGPYLYLILGNASSIEDPKAAMGYYDWARLMAPGTIIEEAALRRSTGLAMQAGDHDKAFRYALNFARRFMTSPYASQFADLLVELFVTTYGPDTEARMQEILSFVDRPRQREIYLRIARRAAIAGMEELARLASERAGQLTEPSEAGPKALADLYSGLVGVPSPDVLSAMKSIGGIPDAALTPRDRALRDAARAIAEEVVRLPDGESLTQASLPSVDAEPVESPGDAPVATDAVADGDAGFKSFLSNGRSRLDEIDALLKDTTDNAAE